MKKSLIVLFFVFLLLVNFVSALDVEDSFDKVGNFYETLDEVGENPDSYLKQEWTKILEESSFGRVLLSIGDFLSNFDFFFEAVFKTEFGFSWTFFFSLVIWIGFIMFFTGVLKGFFDNGFFGFVGGFIVASLAGIFGSIKFGADMLSVIILKPWLAVISFLITILIVFLLFKFGKDLGEEIKKTKEKEEKQKEKRAREYTQLYGEISKKEVESYRKN